MEGTPFGRYLLIELLGRGGMGEVWKAFDTGTQRVVAVKVLPPQLAADPMFEQRFRREAYAAAGLNNPHVVPIHNFGEIDGRLYVDMRLIEGQDLDHILARGPLPPARAVKIVEQVASALNAAHRVGLVHRDVKPSNILVAEDDFAYLIDFGIARGVGETGLTGTGNVVGTFPYMAPERFTSGSNDARSDIYALACVLYECLTGSRPFPGESVEQQIAGHLTTPPPRPSISRPGVSPELDSVIAAGMAKDPEARYGTTVELARAARSALTSPIPKPAFLPPSSEETVEGIAATAPTQLGPAEVQPDPWAPTHARSAEAPPEPWAPTQARPAEAPPEPWAPTQARPAAQPEPWAPTQARPAERATPSPAIRRRPVDEGPLIPPSDLATADNRRRSAPPREPWWRRKGVVIPAALVLIVGAVATILVVLDGSETPSRPSGPLDGTYSVDLAAATTPDGAPYADVPAGREKWVIRSACRGGDCVATAKRLNGSASTTSSLVLDKIGGSWVSVTAAPGTCANAPIEAWESMSLQQGSDGTLQGELAVRTTGGCDHNQAVTFTRTGSVDPNTPVADPDAQPSRVVSPAKGLHGQYQETDTYTADGRSAQADFAIQTYCLRTGERCLSYWQSANQSKVLVYSQDKWVLTPTSGDTQCRSGARAHREITQEYPLPQPASDPITVLTGRGHYVVTGDCPYASDFDSRVERTGD